MESTIQMSLLMVIVVAWSVHADDPLHSSHVKVAQCRAQCLDKFTRTGWTPSDKACKEEPDCFMCWESCELLNQNFVVWGSMCSHSDICFPGCQQSCGFYLQGTLTEKTKPSFTLKFANPMEFGNQKSSQTLQISWSKPEAVTTSVSNGSNNVVYILLRRSRINSELTNWQQVAQTSELKTSLDINSLTPSAIVDFKLIAVTGAGMAGQLVNTYNVPSGVVMAQDGKAPAPSHVNVDVSNGRGIVSAQDEVNSRWRLHMVTMSRNVKLGSVDAIVTWAAPGLTGNFLVTWEVKEGTFAITGHLYTDSTTVSLTLWPDTVYSVQVELVSSSLEQALRSEPLTIDTRVIDGPQHDDGQMDVIEAPKAECNTTLIIASVAVAASLILLMVGAVIFIRRCKQKSANGHSLKFDGLQRMGAIRRKMSLPPLSLECTGGYSNAISPIPPPPSSSLDDKLSAFRVFFENLDNKMTESFSPKQSSFAYSLPQTIPIEVQESSRPCVNGRPRLASEILFAAMEDGVLEDGCAFESVLPTEKLLGRNKAKRSLSTAI